MDFETRPTLLDRLRDPADQEAWREFDARYRDLILNYCRMRGLQPQDAEDVCQAVLIGFTRAAGEFRYDPKRGRFRSYLGRAVAHAIQRHLARKYGKHPLDEDSARALDGLVQDDSVHDVEWEREWMMHHYRRAMRTVRETFEPRSVEVFEHLRDGLDAQQTADRFGISVQAVNKIKQRIRLRMIELIERQVTEEDAGRA